MIPNSRELGRLIDAFVGELGGAAGPSSQGLEQLVGTVKSSPTPLAKSIAALLFASQSRPKIKSNGRTGTTATLVSSTSATAVRMERQMVPILSACRPFASTNVGRSILSIFLTKRRTLSARTNDKDAPVSTKAFSMTPTRATVTFKKIGGTEFTTGGLLFDSFWAGTLSSRGNGTTG